MTVMKTNSKDVSSRLGFAIAVAGIWVCGCSGAQSANQALNAALITAGTQKEAVAHFSGTVTIDGNPPGNTGFVRTLVLLWNPKKVGSANYRPNFVWCDEDGKFEFTTYEKGDGVAAGSYIVGFVQLEGGRRIQGSSGYRGPDRLKNLFNDPDKNKDIPELSVEITAPGKTNWEFKLNVAGREAIDPPGPHAVTSLL
jgi:hypothetical protein